MPNVGGKKGLVHELHGLFLVRYRVDVVGLRCGRARRQHGKIQMGNVCAWGVDCGGQTVLSVVVRAADGVDGQHP